MQNEIYSSFRLFIEALFGDIFFGRSTNKMSLKVLSNQIYFTGFEALGVIVLTSLALGIVLILVGNAMIQNLGQGESFYKLIVSGFITDIAPVIISMILLLRSGLSMTTELGYMKVNQEISALRTMGVSPVSYLISPRVIGTVFSALILSIYFAFSGVVLAYLFSSLFFNLLYQDFFNGVITHLTVLDIFIMITKVSISAFILTVVCCFQGLQVERSFTEIPHRAIKSFSVAFFAILLLNFTISLIRFLL